MRWNFIFAVQDTWSQLVLLLCLGPKSLKASVRVTVAVLAFGVELDHIPGPVEL